MKKNDFIFIPAAILFNILFYEQNPGLNFFIFSLTVSSLMLLFNPEKRNDKQWWYYAGLCLTSSLMVVMINSTLSIFTSVVSVIMLAGRTINKNNSIFLSFLLSTFSIASSFVYWILDLTNKEKGIDLSQKDNKRKLYAGITISVLIALFFFFLYREANPLFKDFTKQINFDWLNLGWIFFTFWGFLVLYGIIYGRKIELLNDIDIKALKNIGSENKLENKTVKYTHIIAFYLFIILNTMLLLINVLDINQIFINTSLPKNVTLSSFVHQAIESLVASIAIATILIMWFFKDELNYSLYGKKVKLAVYIWIFQSGIMVISAIIRNTHYISEYQLTYLRIGVYVFLLLSIIGLIHTFIKIAYQKSAWNLVTKNLETWFLLLCISACINWDKIITHYNISNSSISKSVDLQYLNELSEANLPELIKFYGLKDTSVTVDGTYGEHYFFKQKLLQAKHKMENKNYWQSFNLRDFNNIKAVKESNITISSE